MAARTLLVMSAAALLSGLTDRAPAAPRHPTVEETRAELMEICREQRQGNHPFFGRGPLAGLAARLADEATATPAVKIGIRGQLAHTHLRLGELERAIELLTEAREISRAEPVSPALATQILRDLGLAHLVLAERQNCAAHHHAQSCLLPVLPESRHPLADSTRRAGDAFHEALERDPAEVQTRWLLNLARMLSGEYPEGVPPRWRLPPAALAPEAPFPRWRDLAPVLGLAVYDLSGGAAVEDFDGDGLLDLVTSTWDPCDTLKAFKNQGDGSFAEVTRQWGLDGQLGGLNLNMADFDNDGRLDLLVLRGAWQGAEGRVRNSLLRNEIGLEGGAGRFVDVSRAAGLAEPAYPTQTAAWADYDGDGWLDLYIGNEATPEGPYPSQLFRNQGDGTFIDVAGRAGVENLRFVKGVAWGDFDRDGRPDLYVSNFGDNRLYKNRGDGTFIDVASALGVTAPARSFATWFFDFDNDGWQDLFVADYGARVEEVSASYLGLPVAGGHPLLYRNTGGGFENVSRAVGLTRPLLPMGANFGDLDNDGWLDLYLGTGVPDLNALMPNVMLHNRDGQRLEDVTFAGGFGHLQKGHGVAFADLDHDGQQDLFIQMGGAYPVDAYTNALFVNPGNNHRWIHLRLVGVKTNRAAIGAEIALTVRTSAGLRTLHRVVGTGGSFGASPLRQEIGLGQALALERLTIRWPGSGTTQSFENVAMDRIYRATEGRPELEELHLPVTKLSAE